MSSEVREALTLESDSLVEPEVEEVEEVLCVEDEEKHRVEEAEFVQSSNQDFPHIHRIALASGHSPHRSLGQPDQRHGRLSCTRFSTTPEKSWIGVVGRVLGLGRVLQPLQVGVQLLLVQYGWLVVVSLH